MRKKLLEAIQVEKAELRVLAQERANTIRDYLIQPGRIPENRIFLIEVDLDPGVGKEAVRTQLTLSAG